MTKDYDWTHTTELYGACFYVYTIRKQTDLACNSFVDRNFSRQNIFGTFKSYFNFLHHISGGMLVLCSLLNTDLKHHLAKFQEEVRLEEDEAAAKALEKVLCDSSCMSNSIPLVSFLGHLLPALT